MNIRTLGYMAALTVLSACASKDSMLYHWGSYQDQVYEGFQIESGNTSADKQLQKLQEETQRLETIYRQKLTAFDDLKKSLLHQAFSGQL